MAITKVSDFSISDFPADTTFLLDTNVLYFVHSGYYMPTNPKSQIYSKNIVFISDDKDFQTDGTIDLITA